ncbi:MAG: hypothetical protein LBK47_09040 [Prevotellaceae bacterium]|nr:hypothetical protein [Prevotellaceae bacterium]
MLCKKRRKGEEKDKQKRIIARFTSFCTGYSLQLLEIKSEMDLASLSENVLAYLRYPHEDDVLWLKLANHPATRVSVDIYTLGIVFTLPKLQKQRYCIRL